MISFITIAQNEAMNIADCLHSTRNLGQHYVIDGGSTDGTQELASKLGAVVIENPFQYAAKQYNFALERVPAGWAFIIDADERLSPELRRSLELLNSTEEIGGFWVSRRNIVFGQELLHGGWYPDRNMRLLRIGAARYEDREVHARINVQGLTGSLEGDLLHFTYHSVRQYVAKLNHYTSLEVSARKRGRGSGEAKAAVRQIWLRTPMKPLSKFVYSYIVQQGYRDGRVGFDIAIASAFYEFIVGIKTRYDRD